MKFDKHIFICVNQRAVGSERPSCGEANGMELVGEFKKVLKEKKLPIKIRAQRAGCLDICDFGPTLVIYPEGVFYVNVQLSDVDEIVEQHLVGGKIVSRLMLDKSKY